MRVIVLLGAMGLLCLGAGNICRAQSAPADLSPDVQEVLTLSRQHMDDAVITNYIISTGKAYKLSADDIIYLNGQGVSQPVINALLTSSANAGTPTATSTPAAPAPASSSPASADANSSPTPPPLDDNSSPSAPSSSAPAESLPPTQPVSAPPQVPMGMPMIPAPMLDNFYTDGGLNPTYWQTQSPLLSSLAAMNGEMVLPALSFSPSGMQMSGIGGPGQFMGVQSIAAYAAPFSFSATVAGMSQDAVPFEIYLVSSDMQQWLSVAGHLGGRGRLRSAVRLNFFGPFGGAHVGIPTGGGESPEYGIWVNHTGSGLPIASLGNKIFDHPLAGVDYTVQISVGGDGLAAVTLLDANRGVLTAESVPVGTGPYYVVLAGRDGPTYAEWQSVQVTPLTPPTAAVPQVAVPATPTMDYFQQQLAPYGAWVTVPGYGLCWQPSVDPAWRPYYDGGHWEYTDAGYFWQSDYPWGDIAFHYGRWAYVNLGLDPCWVWVPGFDYAPSWVVWRHDDGDGLIGWAPLPPGAVLVNGGWYFHGAPVGVGFDFGLGFGFFTFIGYDHFWEHDYRHFIVPHDRAFFAFHHSVFDDHYRFDHGVFRNEGLPHDRMAALSHHDFHPTPMGDLRHQEEMHNAMQRNNDMHNYRGAPQHNAPGHGNAQDHDNGQHDSGHQQGGWGSGH